MLDIQAELIEVISQDLPSESRDPVPIDQRTDRAILHCAGFQDGGGSLIEAWSSLQGNDTAVNIYAVDHTTGVRRLLATVTPPPSFKLDSFDMWPSGANLILGMTAHEAISSPTRRNIYARALVPGVLVPYGDGTPRGAWIDPNILGGGEPVPSEPTFTLDDLIARLTTEFRSARADGLGKTMQAHAKNGATDALAAHPVTIPAFLQDQNAFLQVERDGLNQWVMDRVYQVLDENGLLPKPETPPQP